PDTTDLGQASPILILSPEQGEQFDAGEEILIAASFGFVESAIDNSSINIFVDGANVTLEAEISDNVLTYSKSDFQPGKHQVLIQGYYASGAALPAVNWSFTVTGEITKPKTDSFVRGLVFAETRQENISDVGFSDNNIGGNLAGKYGKAQFDGRLYLTTRENGRYQPRNRFSLNVELPVLGFTIGDTYPRFNDLMLWGKRVRGIYGRLHLGFFNVDIIHGQTVRRVAPVTTLDIAGQDSLVSFGTHRQNLFGIRQSFGSGRNFQLGFNLLKVRDDSTSLKAGEFSIAPKDNLVVGSDLLIAFANHRIEFKASGAFSLVTNDITPGSLSKTEIEDQFDVSLPFDPADFNKFLIINSSTTPLDPRDLSSLAYNIYFRFNYFNNNIQVGYKTIGSEYISLGNSYLRNNLRGFYFVDRLRLYKNKIYLNFGLEDYKDNFDTSNQNPSTKLQTINSGISIFPGAGLPNLTFNLRNYVRDNNKSAIDSLFTANPLSPSGQDTSLTDNREYNLTRDLSVQLNYDVNFFQLRNSITLSYIASDRDDRFGTSRLDGVNLTETSSNVQLFSVRTQYQIPLTTTINFAHNDNKFTGGTNNFKFNLLGARAEYLFFNRKLQTYAGINYTTASGVTTLTDSTNALTDYKRLGFNVGARFEISSGQYVFIDGHIIEFNDNGGTLNTILGTLTTSNPSYTDRIFRLYYEKRF
ncbi:MAG: hypothetical protein ACE5HX_09810, partial [bacterium]